jgi:hypothetical protein
MVNIENVTFSDEKRFLLDPRPEHHDYVWTNNIHEESVFHTLQNIQVDQ